MAITSPVDENGTATLTGTITDPGTQDTFSLDVDWGDGSTPETFIYAAGTTGFSETHTYLDDNPTNTSSDSYDVDLTLTDDDTGTDTASTTVTVDNVAPTVTINAGPTSVNEGDAASHYTYSWTDPGSQDSWTPLDELRPDRRQDERRLRPGHQDRQLRLRLGRRCPDRRRAPISRRSA